MAEEKRAAAKAPEKPADKPASKPAVKAAPERTLQSAAASGDPAVHVVLAQIQTAQSNGDTDEVERLTAALGDLGFE